MPQLNLYLPLPLTQVSIFISMAFSAFCVHKRAVCVLALLWVLHFFPNWHVGLVTHPYLFMHVLHLLFLLACTWGLHGRYCISPLLAGKVLYRNAKEITFYIQVMMGFCLLYLSHQAAVGDMIVQDVRYSPDMKKLLVRLSDTYERYLTLLIFLNQERRNWVGLLILYSLHTRFF